MTEPSMPPAAVTAQIDPQQLLTIDQLAGLLQVSRRWIEQQVAGRQLPHTRVGKLVRFSRDDIARIISNGAEPGPSPRRIRGVA